MKLKVNKSISKRFIKGSHKIGFDNHVCGGTLLTYFTKIGLKSKSKLNKKQGSSVKRFKRVFGNQKKILFLNGLTSRYLGKI